MTKKMIDRIFLAAAMITGYAVATILASKPMDILYFGLGVCLATLVIYFTDEEMRS